MTSHTGTSARRASAGRTAGLRRASLAALVLLLIQYGIGIWVNLYVTVPAADHGHTISTAISSGPGALTVHIVLGLLLILAAATLVVQAIMARHPGVIVTSVIGLLALVGAAARGAAFVEPGPPISVHDHGRADRSGVAVLRHQPLPPRIPGPPPA